MKHDLTGCLRAHAEFGCIEGNEKSMLLRAADVLDAQAAEIAALCQKAQENELMAECTVMLRDDLIEAGIVDKTVPPMMLTEAIFRYASALRLDTERLDFLDRQGEAYGIHEHEGNRWLIEGPFKSLRVAIDEDIAQAVQPAPIKIGDIVEFKGEVFKAVCNGDMPGTFDLHVWPHHRRGDQWKNAPIDQLKLDSNAPT
jgi:hypothetical protein